ncbi:MAG: ABC transporter ATP-binding protein [Bacteroidales bacterium]|nr:ABC transporter ATP-binding protein [Lachnoclostridium sp.]MCM1384403.1 ABC transporter ATP-binding protein [Lachnoclostridium sp.]MCM1465183.1 ABC transporter ATP-binding protein [Bacteroidales bacterium]
MKEVLLSARGLCRQFSQGTGREQILKDIDVDIYKGDFTVIMGSSGAGKSTLLYALSGMDSITAGKVLYKGEEISKYKERQMALLRSHEFGFVFQQTHLVSSLSLFENVAVAGYLDSGKDAKVVWQKAGELLKRMGVEKAKDRFPSEVSGGEAQRAAIARAVINHPGLLFADEPTGALNKRNTEEVLSLLTGLSDNGQSILMVTHDTKAAIRGTRILYLEDGKILDELSMGVYRETDAKEREKKLNDWLSDLSW